LKNRLLISPILLTSLLLFSGCLDDEEAIHSDTELGVIYTIDNKKISAPISDATLSISTDNSNKIFLDGSQSNASSNTKLVYQWKIISKPKNSDATLSDTTIVNPTFETDIAGSYEIELIVKDDFYKSEKKIIKVITVGGSVVDGPIYNAKVILMDMNNTILGETITSAENVKIGNYSLAIKNLPQKYIVKIIGGKDVGTDGVIDEDDESSFEMSSIGEQSNPNTFVSPATTLITHLVEDGATFENAKKSISQALGLEEHINLTTTDPKNSDIASKAGTFVAQVLNAIPSSNKKESLNAIAKIFSKESIITINGTGVELTNLNLKMIAEQINSINPDTVSQSDIEKIDITQQLLANKIVSVTQNTQAINLQTSLQKREAIASTQALKHLSKEIKNSNKNDINIDNLQLFTLKLEESFKTLLENNETSLKGANIEILTDVIKNNLDKNSTSMNHYLSKIAIDTNDINESLVNIYKDIYSSIDIEKSDKVGHLDKKDILDLLSTIDTKENKEILESSITSKLVSIVNLSTQDINSSEVNDIQNSIIDNSLLNETLVKLNVIFKDKKEQKISTILQNVLNFNLEQTDFIFNIDTQNSLELLKEKLEIIVVLNDETKTKNELVDELRAIELATILVDLTVEFNEQQYNNRLQDMREIINRLRVIDNSTLDIEFISSISLIKNELQTQKKSALEIKENIEKYIVKKEKRNLYVKSIQIPNVGGFILPNLIEIKRGE